MALKNQYVQGHVENNTLVQSGVPESQEELQLSQRIHSVEKSNLALKMHSKQRQMKQIVSSLDQLQEEIPDNAALQTQIQ